MGLDMYLRAERYLSAFDEKDKEIIDGINSHLNLRNDLQPLDSAGTRVQQIIFNIGYWRKANAIHQYFVKEFADGIDECQPIKVSREDLEKLRDLCRAVLVATNDGKNPIVGSAVLPTCEGFFFGDTEYNQGYIQDIKDTIDIIENALADPLFQTKEWQTQFIYQASW